MAWSPLNRIIGGEKVKPRIKPTQGEKKKAEALNDRVQSSDVGCFHLGWSQPREECSLNHGTDPVCSTLMGVSPGEERGGTEIFSHPLDSGSPKQL